MIPAAASTAVGALVTGPPVAARVVAAAPAAVYVANVPEGGLVALVASDAVHLPNALVLAQPAAAGVLAGVRRGARARVGGGAVLAGGTEVRAGRWWDPRPRLGRVSRETLVATIAGAEARLAPWPPPGAAAVALRRAGRALAGAAARHDAVAAGVAASDLVGLGPGATPAGDDLLAGTIAGASLLGRATGESGAVTFASALASALPAPERRTTALSAALLRHAARGEVAAPAATFLRALAGRAAAAPALEGLLTVGHTSGHDLAAGLLLGARAALGARAVAS